MRYMRASLGLIALIGLAACQQSSSQAAADQAPAPKKSLAHQAQFYQGQDQVMKVENASIEVGKSGDLLMKATGETAGPGYTDQGFMKRIYAAAPPDGIYEFDVVATQPAKPGAQAMTPIKVEGDWKSFPKDRLKGVKFIAKGNEVVAMLPAAKAGS
jgi:hypothetical protein